MRLLAIIAVSAILLTAGCIDFGGKKAAFGPGEIGVENPDISLEIKATPTELKSGRNMTIQTNVTNMRETDITDLSLTLYDPCFFSGNSFKFLDNAKLAPNRTKLNRTEYTAGDVSFNTECELKFKTEYKSVLSMQETIAVLKESEYYNREQKGTLDEVSQYYYSTDNPLQIGITFSEPLPFIEGDEVYMYIDYSYTGDGRIDKMDVNSINMSFPSNLQVDCGNDYTAAHDGSYLGCTGASTVVCGSVAVEDCERLGCAKEEKCHAKTDDNYEVGCLRDYKTKDQCDVVGTCEWKATTCKSETKTLDCSVLTKDECKPETYATCSPNYAILYHLTQGLTFINQKAPKSTCTLKTVASKPVDLGSLSLTATYKYILDNSLLVNIRPR